MYGGLSIVKRKFIVDARYYFDVVIEVDENNSKFKEIMKSYISTISSNGNVESLVGHIIHNYFYLGCSFVEGVGDIEEAINKGAFEIISSEEDSEYDIKENNNA